MIYKSYFFLSTNVYEIIVLWTTKTKVGLYSQSNLNQFSSGILFGQNLEIIRNNLKQWITTANIYRVLTTCQAPF